MPDVFLLEIDVQSKGRSCDVCGMYQTALIASIQMHFRMALSFAPMVCVMYVMYVMYV